MRAADRGVQLIRNKGRALVHGTVMAAGSIVARIWFSALGMRIGEKHLDVVQESKSRERRFLTMATLVVSRYLLVIVIQQTNASA